MGAERDGSKEVDGRECNSENKLVQKMEWGQFETIVGGQWWGPAAELERCRSIWKGE